MNRSLLNHIKKTFILQHDQTDCGVACLLALVRYHRGNSTLDKLRKLSGTNIQGTTLLGLYQAAKSLGFTAEGCTADFASLISHPSPVILHVTLQQTLQHYVVCFGSNQGKDGKISFIIGDPSKGIVEINARELDTIWQSKACLTLEPNESFLKSKKLADTKRKWIINLVKEDYPLLVTAMIIGIIMAALGLTMAIFSQRLIDEILPKKNYEKLYAGIIVVFLMLVVKESLSALRAYILLKQSKDFSLRIVDFFYKHLLQLPKSFFDTRKIGDFTARLSDSSRIQHTLVQLAGNSIIDLLTVLVSIAFLCTYSVYIGVATVGITPFFYILVFRYNKGIINAQKTVMSSYAFAEANYISTLQGIEPIKNQNKQNLFSETNNALYQNYQGAVINLGKIQVRLSLIANVFSIFVLILVLLYGSSRVLNGKLTTGELIAVLSLCGTVLSGIANLALISIPINEAKVAFDRMFEFTLSEPEKSIDVAAPVPIFQKLKVQHLSFRFAGRKKLLEDVSFDVSKGEIIAIMGENGCGKSTLTQILQRHYLPEQGSILLNDHDLLEVELDSLRNLCSSVPQHIHIFNSTVLENIAYDDAINNTEKAVLFLEQYGFLPFLNSLPQSVLTLVGEEGINLSGGQKQIIALARALYNNPQLLILDEATSAMDRDTELFILNLLTTLKHNMGIIFITHRLHVLKNFCDKIYILEDGVISASGDHHRLLQTQNLYSKYWLDLAP